MTPEERVQALGTVVLQASCDCNTCAATRARLVKAFADFECEVIETTARTAVLMGYLKP